MPEGLIAVCGDRQEPELKRVLIDDALIDEIREIFRTQEADFHFGCEEIQFSGTWRADDDEIMTLPLPASAQALSDAMQDMSESSLETVDARNIAEEAVRGIAVVPQIGKVLAQKYYDSQTLLPGRFLIPSADGVSFRRTDNPALTFDRNLVCIIEDGLLKFKSLTALGRLIDTTEIFREATAEEIGAFAQHRLIDAIDFTRFESSLNQVTRKLIYVIQTEEILDGCTIESIELAASQTDFALKVENGRIRLPTSSTEIKDLLKFLNDDYYQGAVSQRNFVSNSKRSR